VVRRGRADARLRTRDRTTDDGADVPQASRRPGTRPGPTQHALHSEESFSSRHRFVDTAGGVHDAIVVADCIVEEAGAVSGTAGYYIDLTSTFDEARYESRREVLDEALPGLVENRAAIEQAKGVMMAVYRLSRDQAFRVLQWRSQETNVKLRTLAKRLIHEVSNMEPMSAAVQSQFDRLLLTVHERIPPETGC
jgi:hypothetical protein